MIFLNQKDHLTYDIDLSVNDGTAGARATTVHG